jgi:hypothetical protein
MDAISLAYGMVTFFLNFEAFYFSSFFTFLRLLHHESVIRKIPMYQSSRRVLD